MFLGHYLYLSVLGPFLSLVCRNRMANRGEQVFSQDVAQPQEIISKMAHRRLSSGLVLDRCPCSDG